MARPTTTIEVENIEGETFEVDLKEKLSWGEKQEIEDVMTEGANYEVEANPQKTEAQDMNFSFDSSVLAKAKYKTLSIVISEIRDEDGETLKFSKKWVNNLTVESGDELYAKADELSSVKKKG